ncbi:hypothetical protein ACOME3_009741 [Neoechinorhynchus agilis]
MPQPRPPRRLFRSLVSGCPASNANRSNAVGLVRFHSRHGSDCPEYRKPPTQPASPSSSNPSNPTELTAVVTDTNGPPPPLIEMLSHGTRMIRRIPRSTRSSVASKLACLIECIVRDPTVPSYWFNLLAFPKAVLRVPRQTSGTNENQSLSQKIRNRYDALESLQQVDHLGWQSHRRGATDDADSQLREMLREAGGRRSEGCRSTCKRNGPPTRTEQGHP